MERIGQTAIIEWLEENGWFRLSPGLYSTHDPYEPQVFTARRVYITSYHEYFCDDPIFEVISKGSGIDIPTLINEISEIAKKRRLILDKIMEENGIYQSGDPLWKKFTKSLKRLRIRISYSIKAAIASW